MMPYLISGLVGAGCFAFGFTTGRFTRIYTGKWISERLSHEDVVDIANTVTAGLLRDGPVNMDTIGGNVASITRSIVEALEAEPSVRP